MLTTQFRALFNRLGFDVVRVRSTDGAGAEPTIIGTFPRYAELTSIGDAGEYFIHEGYVAREEPKQFDDTPFTNEWQLEVYKYAREIFDLEELSGVCDVGCGSAYKLMKYFRDARIVGLDVSVTCEWLKRKYPGQAWMELDFKAPPEVKSDLVIAADVIEHLVDPDKLLSLIETLSPRYLVISTPDRNLLRFGARNGPPRNLAHVREWSMSEFHAYIQSRFTVLEHFISNAAQGTQCVLASPR